MNAVRNGSLDFPKVMLFLLLGLGKLFLIAVVRGG